MPAEGSLRSQLFLMARLERTLAVRSRAVSIFAVAFALLAAAVSGSGYLLTGGSGLQDFARTAVSLVQLVLLLVPLTALLVGVTALTPDGGATEILFAQPVPRSTILLGRLLGLFEALGAAQAVGFGVAALLILWRAGTDGVGGFLLLAAGSMGLTAVFLAVAAAIATGSQGRRTRALAMALVVWFVAVVLFDVAALGLASLLRSGYASRLLVVAVVVNPVDAVRTGTLLGIDGAAAFGAASLAFLRIAGGTVWATALLIGSILLWILTPTFVAVVRLRRADL